MLAIATSRLVTLLRNGSSSAQTPNSLRRGRSLQRQTDSSWVLLRHRSHERVSSQQHHSKTRHVCSSMQRFAEVKTSSLASWKTSSSDDLFLQEPDLREVTSLKQSNDFMQRWRQKDN